MLGHGDKLLSSNATAYVGRDAGFDINVHTRWEIAEDDERCVAGSSDRESPRVAARVCLLLIGEPAEATQFVTED